MIKAEFLRYSGALVGFSVSGHAGAGEYGQDIVCSAVTSAVMLTANTITDFLLADADVKIGENKVSLELLDSDSAKSTTAEQVIASFEKHLEIIAEEAKGTIQITVKEVKARKGR